MPFTFCQAPSTSFPRDFAFFRGAAPAFAFQRTVSERDARIEALEAEAREKDATIAELHERVGQLERPAPRGGGRAKRPRT